MWQPSGNRSTKPKLNENSRKKKSMKKKKKPSVKSDKLVQKNTKESKKSLSPKIVEPPVESAPKQTQAHFQNQPSGKEIEIDFKCYSKSF